MTRPEFNEWRKTAKRIDTCDEDIDRCGNEFYSSIYMKGDALYRVECMNGEPMGDWDEKSARINENSVTPVKVAMKVRLVQETYYEAVKEETPTNP